MSTDAQRGDLGSPRMTFFRFLGVRLALAVVRDIPDGSHVLEHDTNRPVQRLRTQHDVPVAAPPIRARRVLRPRTDGGPSVTEYLRSKGEL